MKILVTLIVLFSLIASCNNIGNKTIDSRDETPKALQEKQISIDSYSRGYSIDLVEALYKDLLKENKQLQNIEDEINDYKSQKSDTLAAYQLYNGKIEKYYADANNHAMSVSDSVLKQKLLTMIKTSTEKYKKKSGAIDSIIKQIEVKDFTINDYHVTMKIVFTLPLIEKFQDKNRPKTTGYKGIIKTQDEIIKKMDLILKK